MVRFLNATQARGEIESIISNAKYNLSMISPYIRINDDFITRLTDACKTRQINVSLVCREKDLKPDERRKLESIPNLSVNFNERVHAKCFFNEDSMVITSLNLYESSMGDNREMGVLLKNSIESDKEAFEEAKREAQFILRETRLENNSVMARHTVSKVEDINTKQHISRKENRNGQSLIEGITDLLGLNKTGPTVGHCIRCGEGIAFALDAPYCIKHYKTWVRYKDEDYPEKYCLECGKPNVTSKKHPLCSKCNKKFL